MIKIFVGDGAGVVVVVGSNSKRDLKWGSRGWGSLRNRPQNILKKGWVKAKIVRRGGGLREGVTTLPPVQKF